MASIRATDCQSSCLVVVGAGPLEEEPGEPRCLLCLNSIVSGVSRGRVWVDHPPHANAVAWAPRFAAVRSKPKGFLQGFTHCSGEVVTGRMWCGMPASCKFTDSTANTYRGNPHNSLENGPPHTIFLLCLALDGFTHLRPTNGIFCCLGHVGLSIGRDQPIK